MSGHIELTIPQGLSHDKILESLDRLKPQLLKLPRRAEHFISETTSFRTFTFEACIKKYEISNQFRMTLRNGMLTVFVPENVDILSLTIAKHYQKSDRRSITPRSETHFAH